MRTLALKSGLAPAAQTLAPSHEHRADGSSSTTTTGASQPVQHPVTKHFAASLQRRERTVSLAELKILSQSFRRHEALSPQQVAVAEALFTSLRGEALRAAMQPVTRDHRTLGYNDARRLIFGALDNRDGVVTDVYAGRQVRLAASLEDPGVNLEHVWPQDNGIEQSGAVTDLHNLLPADREANMRRGNVPFGEVVDVVWHIGDSKLGTDAAGRLVWEPPSELKGRIARIMCYVAVTYEQPIAPLDAATYLHWNRVHAVSDYERQRNADIARLQGRTNPFVDNPTLVDRLLGASAT